MSFNLSALIGVGHPVNTGRNQRVQFPASGHISHQLSAFSYVPSLLSAFSPQPSAISYLPSVES
jgi:hypothetical protein